MSEWDGVCGLCGRPAATVEDGPHGYGLCDVGQPMTDPREEPQTYYVYNGELLGPDLFDPAEDDEGLYVAVVTRDAFLRERERADRLDRVLKRLRPVARACGYAIAVHGSLNRDLDLIAVPWIDTATDPPTLIERLCEQADLMVMPNDGATTEPVEYPVEKPRGRQSWALAGCPAPWWYIDLSVVDPLPMFQLAAEYREQARRERERAEAADRLYDVLSLFDTRDGTPLAGLIRAVREGWERSDPEMAEDDAWGEFDALWSQSTSEMREEWCPPWRARAERAEAALEELADRCERDRREPDKILCNVLSARSAVLAARDQEGL